MSDENKRKKTTVEMCNGYDIDRVEREFDTVDTGLTKATTYTVLTSRKPRRIVKDGLWSIEEARQIAAKQPPGE